MARPSGRTQESSCGGQWGSCAPTSCSLGVRIWASAGRGCGAVGNSVPQSGSSGNNLLSPLHSDMTAERRAPSPDVIVLSDNEQPVSPRVNGLPKEALQETSTEALMVSLVPELGTTPPSSIPEYGWGQWASAPGGLPSTSALFSACRKAVPKNGKG